MINITLYGKPSYTYSYMKAVIQETADQADIEVRLEEVSDTASFFDKGIMSIPAYQLNGTVSEKGDRDINDYLRELRLALVQKANYKNMRRIFVPIDFTDTSDNTSAYAINFSKYFQAALHLVHVYHPTPPLDGESSATVELEKAREEQLTTFTERLNKSWTGNPRPLIIDSEMRVGLASEQLELISNENPDQWIMIGSSDTSKTVKNIFGSVTISLAKKSSGPLFIIPPKASFQPYQKVAFCSDDEELDAEAVDELIEILKPFDTEIEIIHVQNESHYDEFRLLNLIKDKYPASKIRFQLLRGENQIETINSYCRNNDIQLLAMARRKRSMFYELFHKSLTKQLAIQADIPLLILNK